MRLTFQDIEEILFDGTDEQLAKLAEAAKDETISYVYYENTNAFEMVVGTSHAKMHEISEVPNCVYVFGPSHSFS